MQARIAGVDPFRDLETPRWAGVQAQSAIAAQIGRKEWAAKGTLSSDLDG